MLVRKARKKAQSYYRTYQDTMPTSQNVKEEYCQEGYLDKQGTSVASFWKRRYVGCTETEIQYFGDKKYAHNKHAQKGQNQTPHTLSKKTPACLPLIGLIRGRRDSDR